MELSAYVDDTTMTVHGSEHMTEGEQGRDIVKCLSEVTSDLRIVYHTALEVGVAVDKLTSVASTTWLAQNIVEETKCLGGADIGSMANLGIDYRPAGRVK